MRRIPKDPSIAEMLDFLEDVLLTIHPICFITDADDAEVMSWMSVLSRDTLGREMPIIQPQPNEHQLIRIKMAFTIVAGLAETVSDERIREILYGDEDVPVKGWPIVLIQKLRPESESTGVEQLPA